MYLRPGSGMTDKEFKRLLEKYQAGTCTPEEKKLVEQWYESFEKEEDGIQGLSPIQLTALEEKIQNQIRQKIQLSSGRKIISLVPYIKISVAALILILFGYFSWYYIQQTTHDTEYLTILSKQEIKKVILSDGTLIWLKGNSQLTYPRQFKKNDRERSVELSGEALFEVAKNTQQPFLIHCGKIQAKVLGTSFNVKQSQEKQQVEVVVLTGKVALTLARSEQKQANTIVIEPMERAVSAPDGFSKQKVQDVASYTRGTTYHMRFDETPVEEVLERIERKFEVEILYKDAADNCRITADFTDQSLENTLRMMTSTLGEVQYEIKGNSVTLKGKACQ